MFPEYHGNIVRGDRDAVDETGTPCAQTIGVQFEFLLLKAIQELKTEVDFRSQKQLHMIIIYSNC